MSRHLTPITFKERKIFTDSQLNNGNPLLKLNNVKKDDQIKPPTSPKVTQSRVAMESLFSPEPKEKQTKKGSDQICIILFLIEIAALACLTYFSNITFKLAQNKDLFQSVSDPLWRQCGFTSVIRNDVQSPNIYSIAKGSNISTLCTLLNSNYNLANMSDYCNTLLSNNVRYDVNYFKYIEQISKILPDPGNTGFQTLNGTICLSRTDVLCSTTGDFICMKEFGILLEKIDPTLFPNYSNKQEFTKVEYDSISTSLSVENKFLLNFCHNASTTTLKSTAWENFQRCDQIASTTSTDSSYVTYATAWISSALASFIQEIYTTWKPIIYSFAVAIGCAYIYVIMIMIFSKFFLIVTSAIPSLIVLGLLVITSIWYQSRLSSTQFLKTGYGYINPQSQVANNLIIVLIVILAGVLTALVALFIMNIQKNFHLADCITISKLIITKRIGMFFVPIVFVIILMIHIAICIAIIVSILYSCSYNSQLNAFSFDYITTSYSVASDKYKLVAIIIALIFLLHGIVMYFSLCQMCIVYMTISWFKDHIIDLKQEKQVFMKQACKDTFKRIGTSVYFGFLWVISSIVRIMIYLYQIIENFFDTGVHEQGGKFQQKYRALLKKIMVQSNKATLIQACLSGDKLSVSSKVAEQLFVDNRTFVDQTTKITNRIALIGKIVIVAGVVAIEQVIEGGFTFKITPVICCVILSFIVANATTQILTITNYGFVGCINYETRNQKKLEIEKQQLQIQRVLKKANLVDHQRVFQYSETIKALFERAMLAKIEAEIRNDPVQTPMEEAAALAPEPEEPVVEEVPEEVEKVIENFQEIIQNKVKFFNNMPDYWFDPAVEKPPQQPQKFSYISGLL